MSLVSLKDAELAFGLHPLLDRANLAVADGERIGLIGRNGTGKSSLLAVIAGERELDDGELKRSDGLNVVLVEQEPSLPAASTLRESLALRGHLERIADERVRWRVEAKLVEFLHRFGLDEASGAGNLLGRGAQARGARAGARARARPAAARRADEPSRHRGDRAARRAGAQASGRDRHHARPRVPRSRRDAHRRAGPRPAALVSRQLRGVPGAEDRRAGRRASRRTASSTSSGPRKRRGSARASKRGARATRAACGGWMRCATSARHVATGLAT